MTKLNFQLIVTKPARHVLQNKLHTEYFTCDNDIQGGPKKVSHYQMTKESYYRPIILKPVNEITFIPQIKV